VPKSLVSNLQARIILTVAVLLALTALAAGPFLARPGLPRNTDAELHVFRAAQLGEALRGGAGYVRWAPDLWYGYGYPIFNYYSPLTYYLVNLLTLFGLDIVNAVKAVFILGLLGAAAGMYVLVRGNWGERAGGLAAAAYVFSPYVLFIDPHMRGDLAESVALALFPWLLWAFQIPSDKSAHRQIGRSVIGVVLWAALILTHALMALVLSAILVAWMVWQLVLLRPGRQHLVLGIGYWVFALGLSAIYWLPFILERNAVHLSVVGPGQFDFHNHFVAWRDLFAASPTLDLGATAPRYIRNLGLAQWLLALLVIPAILRCRREPRSRLLAFFVLGSLFLIFLVLSPSAFVWERVPLMSFIQFPWRLLGPAAAMLAVCAGAGVSSIKYQIPNVKCQIPNVKWAEDGATIVAWGVILVLALPTLYPPVWGNEDWPTSPRGIIGVELQGRWLGTTSTGDFVPSTVKADPPANADLVASYDRGEVDKFDHTSLPQGANVSVVEHGPTHDRFTVSSPQAFVARALTFDFPGWRATVDKQPVPITPSDPHGFVTFPVPAGTHDVRVEFGTTLPRTAGAVISVATLILLAWLAIQGVTRGKAQVTCRKSQATPAIPNTQSSNLWIALVTLVMFALLKVELIDRCETCFRVTSPPGQALAAQYKIDPQVTPSDLAHVITLLGFDLPQREVRAGGSFPLTLYWKATAPVPVNYQAFVHLGNEPLWGQPLHDKLNPGDFATTRWPLDKYVWDDYATPYSIVRVKPDTPPGEYEIRVGLYTLADGVRAPVFDGTGKLAGDSIVLPIKIRVLAK
jgi:hypothetical protein